MKASDNLEIVNNLFY